MNGEGPMTTEHGPTSASRARIAAFLVGMVALMAPAVVAASAQAAYVSCTATTDADLDISFVSNHRGECYRVQAQARVYTGLGKYKTTNGSMATYSSRVDRGSANALDLQKVRAQPVNTPENLWTGFLAQPQGVTTYFKFSRNN